VVIFSTGKSSTRRTGFSNILADTFSIAKTLVASSASRSISKEKRLYPASYKYFSSSRICFDSRAVLTKIRISLNVFLGSLNQIPSPGGSHLPIESVHRHSRSCVQSIDRPPARAVVTYRYCSRSGRQSDFNARYPLPNSKSPAPASAVVELSP